MSLISSTIANLINGVSQQPSALRLASQCELQENCNSSVVDGLCMRNGSKHSAKVSSTPMPSAFTHLINRDESERYRVVIANNTLQVFDLNGVQQTVNFVGAGVTNYLVSETPADDFAALTVADYTFIVHKRVVVTTDPSSVTPARPHEALVWVKQAVQDTQYTLNIDGFVGVFTTGDAQSNPTWVSTSVIASALVSGADQRTTNGNVGIATGMGAATADYNFSVAGSFIYINRVNAGDFTIAVTDGYGDQGINLIKGSTQRFTNLPARAYPGFKVEVQGEGSSFNTSYWVEFVSDANNPYGGVWKETVKPSEVSALNPATMPHVLVREADGTFSFKYADWVPRKCGDLTSNPMPSFLGRTINDIFFHRSRLGFLSDENMILSKSGEFFDFFKGSAIQILDTDPIDIAASHTKVSILNSVVAYQEGLLLFSEQSQFMLAHTNDVLSVKTASLDLTTEFEASTQAKPVGVGNSVYFVQTRNSFSAVREFTVDSFTQTNDAQDVTSHVPKYIPKNVFKLASSTTENIVVALSHDAPSKLFVYQFYHSNGAKLQSAWHTWTLGDNDVILNADFIESDLHLVVSRPDGVFLEVITVTPSFTEGSQPFSIHLDRKVDETKVTGLAYNAGTDRTSFTLPYTPQAGEEYALIAWEGNTGFKVGRKAKFAVAGNVVSVTDAGNLQHFKFGRVFKARYVLSQLEVREQPGGGGAGQVAIGEGRVNVRRISLTHGKSGYFRVEVTPRGRDMYTYVMSGRQVGSSTSLIGSPSLIEGIHHVPVMCRNIDANIEITSDEFLPFSILSADWEAMFVIRSRRM